MDQPQLNWIANFIWGIADDVLRDVYESPKYRDIILPMTVIRRLDAVLEPTKQDVLSMKHMLDQQGVVRQDAALRKASGQAFYNTSSFTLRDLSRRRCAGWWRFSPPSCHRKATSRMSKQNSKPTSVN
jgi:type I restriction enzyme M protein